MARSLIKKYRFLRKRLIPMSRKKSRSGPNSGHRNYSLYINRVLKEVVPQRSISSRTLDVMNTAINNIFEHIAMEAQNRMCSSNRCTLTPEDIQKAVCSLLPEKLAKQAVAFGGKAVHKFVQS